VERTEPGMTIARGGTVGEAIESQMVQDRLLARLSLNNTLDYQLFPLMTSSASSSSSRHLSAVVNFLRCRSRKFQTSALRSTTQPSTTIR